MIQKKEISINRVKIIVPFAFLFVSMLIIHRGMTIKHDDTIYVQVPLDSSFFDYLQNRFMNWSSRVLVDIVVVVISNLGLTAWKIIDSAVFTSIAVSMDALLNETKDNVVRWAVCLLVFSFPYVTMGTAGWIATTAGYTWTFAAGAAALLPFRTISRGEKFSCKRLFLIIPCWLYATDEEQLAIVALIALVLYYAKVIIIDKKRCHGYAKTLLVITIAKVVFIFSAPGNNARTTTEIGNWFPAYNELSLVDKVYIGIMYTARVLIDNPLPLLTTVLFVNLLVGVKKTCLREKVLATTVSVTAVLLTIGQDWLAVVTDRFHWVRDALYRNETSGNIDYNLIVLFLIIVLALLLMYLVFVLFGKNCICYEMMLLLGMASQMMMAFSPTVYASNTRTGFLLYFAFIAFSIILVRELFEARNEKASVAVWVWTILCFSVNFLSQYGLK